MTNMPGVRSCNLEDPRPLKYRNLPGKMDLVRNTIVNYCATTQDNLALRYAFPGVKLLEALADHDYLEDLTVYEIIRQAIKVYSEVSL